MHHSSATMCSTHRQLPAPALAAAIPKHPPLSRPRSDGPEAHGSALSRHPPRTSCPAALGGLDSHRIPRSHFRPARHASNLDLFKFLAGPWLLWPQKSCWQQPLPAATCRAVFAAKGRQADAAVRVSAALYSRDVAKASCGAARPGQYETMNVHGCLCRCTVSHVFSQSWTYASMDSDPCICISASCASDCCRLAAGIG